jgi:peptide/nickel transport system permease protein
VFAIPQSLAILIAKRILYSIPVVIGVTFITFLVAHVIVPDPVRAWVGEYSNPELIAAYTLRYHLNDPIWLQYLYYMYDIGTLNFGLSTATGTPVIQQIEVYFPETVELVGTAIVISFILGVTLGAISAVRSDTKLDFGIRALYLAGLNTPAFLAGLLLQFLFCFYFRALPSTGVISAGVSLPPPITHMMVVDSLLAQNWPAFWSSLQHLILPASALAFVQFGFFARITRSSMLDVLSKDYMRAARARGLSAYYVNVRHGLRTAFITPVTALSLAIAFSLGGAVIVEYIFGWPGIGTYTVTAIGNEDFPQIMAVVTIFALGVVAANLVADILYAVLDPRLRT